MVSAVSNETYCERFLLKGILTINLNWIYPLIYRILLKLDPMFVFFFSLVLEFLLHNFALCQWSQLECCTIWSISVIWLHCFWHDIHKLTLFFLIQATSLLSEIFPGSSPKVGPTYWDQIQELATISVIKRVLQRLHDILDLVSFYFVSNKLDICKPCLDHFAWLLPLV